MLFDFSVIGWDHVTQGLVQLGFSLMDAFGPKASFGRITDVIPTTKKTPNQKACSLGTNILIHTFKVSKTPLLAQASTIMEYIRNIDLCNIFIYIYMCVYIMSLSCVQWRI